jgi:hypothetical protein
MFVPGFTQPQQFFTAWTQSAREQIAQFERLSTEMQKVQGQGVERVQQAIDESAKLMKESLSYGVELSQAWQKLALEMTKKSTEGMS